MVNRKKLYQNLLSTGKYDESSLGTFDQFNSLLNIPERNKKLYENVVSELGEDYIGDYKTFNSLIAIEEKPTKETKTATVKEDTIDKIKEDDSVEKLLLQIEKQEAISGPPELPKSVTQEVDYKNMVKKKKREELTEQYGTSILYGDIVIDHPWTKEVYDEMRNETIDNISQPFQYDHKVDSVRNMSESITGEHARKIVLNEFNDYVYDKVFDTRERNIFDAMKAVSSSEKKYKEDQSDDNLASLIKSNEVLTKARGDEWKPLLDDKGEFVDNQWKDLSQEDREEIQLKTKEYQSWTPEKLYSLYVELTAKDMALSEQMKELSGKLSDIGYGTFTGIPLGKNKDITEQLNRIDELKKPIFKDLKAISHSLLLNRDLSSVKTNWLQFVGRGLLEGLDGLNLTNITTESQLQEQFNRAVVSKGGQITEAQYEAAVRDVWDKSAIAFGNSLPIMAELAVTKGVTGGIAKGIRAGKYAQKLIALSRLKYGRKGEMLARMLVSVGSKEIRSAIEFGLTPDERVTAAMGAGEGFAQRLNNFAFKGKRVGRVGEFLIRTISGGSVETLAEFSGEFANNLTKNGFNGKEALEKTFGSTKDEVIDNLLVTGILCAGFSGTSNIGALTKIRSSIESMPQSEAQGKGIEVMNEIISEVQESATESTDQIQSEAAASLTEMDGFKTAGTLLSTSTDNTIKKIEGSQKATTKDVQDALIDVGNVLNVISGKTPEELEYTKPQLDKSIEALTSAKDRLESYLEQNPKDAEEKSKVKAEELDVTNEFPVSETIKTALDAKGNVVSMDVIEKDNKVGEVVLEKKENDWNIVRIDVKADDRRRGIAKESYKKLNNQAKEQGKILTSNKPDKINQESRRIWESLVRDGDAIQLEDGSYMFKTEEYAKEQQGRPMRPEGAEAGKPEGEIDRNVPEVNKDVVPIGEETKEEIKEEPTGEIKLEKEIEIKPKKASETISKTLAFADKSSKDLAGVTLTQDNLGDFEKVVKDATVILKGLDFLGEQTRKLTVKATNISKRLQNAKQRGFDIRKKGERYSTEDLTTMFLDDLKRTVDAAKESMANKVRKRTINELKSMKRKSVRKVSGKLTGTREAEVIEFYNAALDKFANKEVMSPEEAVEVFSDPEINKSQEAKAYGAMMANNLLNNFENWGLEEWVNFEETIKDIDKASRQLITSIKTDLKEKNKQIRESIDDNIDLKTIPSTQAELSQAKARKEGFVSKEEASNIFSRKLISGIRKTAASLDEAKREIISRLASWSLHIGTITSLLDKNEATAESGVLYDKIVRPIQKAYSSMLKGVHDQRRTLILDLVEKLNPERYSEIKKSNIQGERLDKKIEEAFYDIVEKNIINSDRFTVDIEIDGKKSSYNFNVDTLMKIYAWSKDPGLALELEEKHGITGPILEAMKKHMGSFNVEFVDYVVENFNKKYYNRLNDAYKKMYYTNMPFIENYFPVRRSGLDFTSEIKEGNLMSTLSPSISAIKGRTKTSKPLEIISDGDVGFMKLLFDHIKDAEHFIAYSQPVRNVNAALRSRNLSIALDYYKLKNTITNQLMSGIGKSREAGIGQMKMLNRIYNAYGVAALGARLIQIPKQMTSFIQAMPDYVEANGGNLTSMFKFIANAAYNSTFLVNPHAAMRMRKIFTKLYNASPAFRERVDSKMISIDITSETNQRPWQKLSPLQKLQVITSKPTKWGDQLGIILGYSQIYEQILKATGDEAKAIEAFEEYEKTQQARNALFYNTLQLSDSPFSRMFTAFRSSPILFLNKAVSAAHAIKRGYKREGLKGIKQKDVMTLITNWSISNVLFQAVASSGALLRGDDEEYLLDLARSAVVGPLNGIFAIGDISEWLFDIVAQGWGTGSVKKVNDLEFGIGVEQMITDIMKPLSNTKSSDSERIAESVFIALQLTGMPLKTLKSMGEGITELPDDPEESIKKIMGYTEYQREGKKKEKVKGPGF